MEARERLVRWVDLDELTRGVEVACVDGRADEGVLGAPGGAAGELILALGATEELTGVPTCLRQGAEVLDAWLDAFGRFYLHTDAHHLGALGERLRGDAAFAAWREDLQDVAGVEAFLRQPPREARGALADLLVDPAFVGCGHLGAMLREPAAYGVRLGLVQCVIRAFHQLLWKGSEQVSWVRLDGHHGEVAVLEVRTCVDGRTPLVAPLARGEQAFVHHPEALDWLRRRYARFLVIEAGFGDLDEERLHRAIRDLAARQLAATLERLAAGLPVYDVTVCDGEVRLEERGRIADLVAAAS